MMEEYLWVEKYRPRKIDDCILSEDIKSTFGEMVDSGESQNLLLCGGPGCGKTTVAKALCNELESEFIMINCSEDGNIDTLRTTIRNFASTVSMTGGKKVVILDEFDYSNAQSTQPALRGFIEEFSKNCRFILTCNYKNRIIEPLHSRCTIVEFKIPTSEKPKLAMGVMNRVKYILDNENIEYDDKVLAQLIMKHFPDIRRVLNELQRYSVGGVIDVGILSQFAEISLKELVGFMRSKEFSKVRSWVVDHMDNDQTQVFRTIYDGLYDNLKGHTIPEAVLILAEYQYKSAFVADQEINMVACLTELMMRCEFK
jgi:DNA polymerase III delta prime subunit|tara:strand:+ start:844 stop:1782 length:939 start_codon:yes stop_codon:yes gene_type:complete